MPSNCLRPRLETGLCCAPLGAWLPGYPLARIGLLAQMISLIAMSWNMLFDAAFDHVQRRMGFDRTLTARTVHSVIFEIGLLLAVVPLAAWWLGIGLWQAFLLDIGIALFFLLHTFSSTGPVTICGPALQARHPDPWRCCGHPAAVRWTAHSRTDR